jgi:hypothetical protein
VGLSFWGLHYATGSTILDALALEVESEEEPVTKKIRVLAVDDHTLLREGIAAVIDGEDDIELVAEATTGEEAIQLFRLHRPDVTLMDLQMPGEAWLYKQLTPTGGFCRTSNKCSVPHSSRTLA